LFSSDLEEAIEILDAVKAKPQTMAERKRLSIDLAALMLREASRSMTTEEKTIQQQLSRLMHDPVGKAFTAAMTDECFRSQSHERIADQMIYLLQQMGVPQYLPFLKRAQLFLFKFLPVKVARFLIPFAAYELRKQTERVILPGEPALLSKHLAARKAQGVRLNLNHLGEAILSEAEAKKRLRTYLDDLEKPGIDYMSVKISTIFSQINLLAWDETVHSIAERLKLLYRTAMKHKEHKFVNLDMEEYRDLHLTVDVFQKVLDDPEFHNYSAGIVLQAYLPDSYAVQKKLTEWAKKRIQNGGARIKIRIVKGANLAMEQFEASLKGWPQAPYTAKVEVDANYKRMVLYGCLPENARAVHLGIASHNLFDIAFAMLLRVENQVEPYVGFEMLEGMADHIRRVVQKLSGDILLYCPVATKEEFQHAIAYLIRRLDENTGPENFLRHAFGLKPGTESWESQTSLFLEACDEVESAPATPRRIQNRMTPSHAPQENAPFENEPDTDFSLPHNRKWAEQIVHRWKDIVVKPLPLVIGGKEQFDNQEGVAFSPNNPSKPLFHYAKATHQHVQEALACAKHHEKQWAATSVQHRSALLAKVAQNLRERRGELIGAMMVDGGKIVSEADAEISEAIDFAEYYRRQMGKMEMLKDLHWSPKGTVLVTPPWNFPCAIPAGGMIAALMTGNCVLLKPASDAVLVAWHTINALWDAGIPKEVLQFIPCSGEGVGSELIKDPRVNAVILTGGTDTARKFLQMRPDLDLAAETGGKNALIVTALGDRDLAVKDLIQSAFGHGGQKCSAASLAILEAEVYDDPHFLRHLREATASLKVGPSHDLTTKINPLIHEPRGVLKRALTTLEPGEKWLLEPRQDPHNPCLWSPGIKLGVAPGSFTHMTELFGPVLGLMRASNLVHALELANAVPFGLTAGLQSLDEREQAIWIDSMQAGNLYINRTTTGAIVRRQPFGGIKASSFGGGSKAGGPNYLREFTHVKQVALPQQREAVNEWVNSLTTFLEKIELNAEQLGLWTASVANYAYWWKRLKQDRDPTKVVGQDNFFRYTPRERMVLRLEKDAPALDALRICAAALTVGSPLEISWSKEAAEQPQLGWLELVPVLQVTQEGEDQFLARLKNSEFDRIRLAAHPSHKLQKAAANAGVYLVDAPVLANGRFELLHYLQEVSISIDYHRYGNLGLRDGELRSSIL
ncbi:MAG TPA: proline dehydrogenase family protein, partial [Chlamydiales bacterium]|jgi:RHH-type proline utilization regulon transcriptional repressor/proline dehydrogenase/delta 1-pyrroline-5-carboxylate dehydrogenase